MNSFEKPVVLIHGLWNSGEIFNLFIKKLDDKNIEYFAPTLKHDFGKISIIEITKSLNKLIIEKYGYEKKIDIIGFSMGGLIARNWIYRFEGYKRTEKFISIGSPHFGTLTAQLVPSFLLKGISEMKISSRFLIDLSKFDYLLENVECISFFTNWDLMVFPGWKAYLPRGNSYSLRIFKHKDLIRDERAIEVIFKELIN